jgi:hypothetical protein
VVTQSPAKNDAHVHKFICVQIQRKIEAYQAPGLAAGPVKVAFCISQVKKKYHDSLTLIASH